MCTLLAFAERQAVAEAGSVAPPFRFYTVLDGLTQSNVLGIDQDQAGYLWATTARGLNRFDGKDFEHLTIADGLPNNWLTAIRVSPANTVWVGDQKGSVTEIVGARVAHTVPPIDGANKPVLDLEYVGGGILSVVEKVGILKIVNDGEEYSQTLFAGDASLGIQNLEVFGETIWVESNTGLYRLNFGAEQPLELLDSDIRSIHADNDGVLWAANTSGGVGVWKDGHLEEQLRIESENKIVDIVSDRRGLIWVATSNELFSFRRSEPGAGDPVDSLKQYNGVDDVKGLFVDQENSLWLYTSLRMIRFLGDRFRHYTLRSDSSLVTVWSVGEDRLGRFWFGTQSKLLLRDDDENLTTIGAQHGLPAGAVRDLMSDGRDTVWAGVTHHGLYKIDVDTLGATHVDGTLDLEILDIDIASDGAVWFSTIDSGVFRYDSGSDILQRFPTPDSTSVYSLDAAADGSIWYGADEAGLVQLVPNGDGAFSETIITGPNNEALRLFDHIRLTGNSSAWIATEEGGLLFFEDGEFTAYGLDTPLADQTVYIVEPLDNGTVVAGGEQGLYQFVPGEQGFAHYNPQVGFNGLETNVHASFRDSSGSLWFGTVDGATRMDVSQPMPESFEPKPNIVRVESELDGRQIADNEELDPEEFGAHIEYAAISLLSPKGIQYSYKLIGEDSGWGSPTKNRSVSYPRIPPGSYEFIVRARHPGGEWGPEVASQRFSVLPYFWQTPWFIIAVLVAVLAAVRVAIVFRTRKIEWMNETLRAQVEDRTKSIEQARRKLESTNERLSEEVNARNEIETRFRLAFKNAPIGMGLLDADGELFDANPALLQMFWPDGSGLPEAKFAEIVSDDDRPRFNEHYKGLVCGDVEHMDEKLCCIGADGLELQSVVNLSTVRSEDGDFLYTVFQIQDITESLKLTVQLEYQASYDELTELLNRRAFEAQLEKAWESGVRRGKQSFLMFMDLDQFKVVNDTSGHTAGDQLLRAVSAILLDNVRANDIVGRLGGDEFGIILWECPTEVAKRIAESIRSSIENFRFQWDIETYRIGVSIGGVPIDSSVGDINELQQLADAACYAAKEAGRNRVHMVDGDRDSARVHRGQVRWVQRIREAMDNNRFAIYAQPIRPIIEKPDEPERLEILLRLRDPETRKLIPPGAFLPAAERYGLSVELDKWVVRSLLDTLFIHSAFQAENRSYWINLSGSSVGDKRFAEFLTDAIRRSPLPPGTVNFEITETAVIRSVSDAGHLMAALREMGCQFALDDFGSGLSSFGYLKKLPVDYIKIDGMFIRDLMHDQTDRIFVKSIIDIAKTLNIETIAEFVESDEILEVVTKLGAGYAQGFAVGRPFELAPRFPRTANSDVAVFHAKTG